MSWVSVAILWAVLTNTVLHNLFDVFLVVKVAGWKKLLGMWPTSFFSKKRWEKDLWEELYCQNPSKVNARGFRITLCRYVTE